MLVFLKGVTVNDFPVAVSTSGCDGLYSRLVDCLYASLPKFHNRLAPRYH